LHFVRFFVGTACQKDNRLVGKSFAKTVIPLWFFSTFFADDEDNAKVLSAVRAATTFEIESVFVGQLFSARVRLGENTLFDFVDASAPAIDLQKKIWTFEVSYDRCHGVAISRAPHGIDSPSTRPTANLGEKEKAECGCVFASKPAPTKS
jgi:hypothetical protein